MTGDDAHLIDLLSFPRRTAFGRGACLAAAGLTTLVLSACQGLDNPGTNAILATAQRAVPFGSSPVDGARLNPDLGYLRVTYDGNLALFALGFVDRDQFGYITVYYGPERSMLKLQNGHVLSLQGTSLEWHAVQLSENPGFPAALGHQIERRRDVEPGDRFDRADQLAISASAPQGRALQGIDASILTWYSESTADLPEGRVATNSTGLPVYGEQWLDEHHLLTWQLWPVERIHPLP